MVYKGEEGYTFIEIFITILILGLISTIIYVNGSTILNSITKGDEELKTSYALTTLILTLNSEAQNITPLWFLDEYKVETEGDSLKIYYYNGDKNKVLSLTSNDSGVTISNNRGILFYSELLTGNFSFKESKIVYSLNERILTFALGVTLA